jgi:hypothetical protein
MVAKQHVLKHTHDLISTTFFHTQHSVKLFPPFFLSLIQTTTFFKFLYFSFICFTSNIPSYSYIFFLFLHCKEPSVVSFQPGSDKHLIGCMYVRPQLAFFYCACGSLARQKRIYFSFPQSLTRWPILHATGQAQASMRTINHERAHARTMDTSTRDTSRG